jgi:phytanoyl-CoA hydroxylase
MTSLLDQFNHDGFLVLEGFNSAEECDALIERAGSLSQEFSLKGKASIFETGSA